MTDKSKLYILKTITYLYILPAIFFSLNPIHSRAEKADREKPINIEANSAEMDDKTSTAIFQG
jgi:lipopolysaccharide export system protein LptA